MTDALGEGQLSVGAVKYDLKLTIQGIITLESEYNRNIAILFSGFNGGLPPYSTVARVLSVMSGESLNSCLSITMSAGLENVYAALVEVIAKSLNPKGIPEGEG